MSETGSTTLLKKTAKKKASGKEVVKQDDAIADSSTALENMGKEEAFELIPTLTNTVDYSYFRLGGVLAVVQSNDEWFKDEGFDTFRDFIESKFGLQYRKAMYLIGIYTNIVEAGVPYQKFDGIGWTKIKEIAGVVTPDNVDEWVDRAKTMSTLALNAYVKKYLQGTLKKSDEKPGTGPTQYTVKVHPDQKATIEQAVEKAMKEANTEFKGVALEAVCMNYLSGAKVGKTKGTNLQALMNEAGYESVLNLVGELWPELDIKVVVG